MIERRIEISEWLKNLQNEICAALENVDGKKKFREDNWTREEGGGGRSRVIEDGKVFEKGGVNFSAVFGKAPGFLFRESEHSISTGAETDAPDFFATGVSIVIHPQNPFVPIIHMNIRYFEMTRGKEKTEWLGGGIDLTPHYFNKEEFDFFHAQIESMCNRHHKNYYKKFSEWADRYFYLAHRKETRGIGGIFFDRLQENKEMSFEKNLAFWKDTGKLFAPLYAEIVNRKKEFSYGENEKNWQLLRRGRYVEFNLVYDKGTKFGLETGGRTESILMSLPKYASWIYDYRPLKDSEEQKTIDFLRRNLESF